MAELEGTSRKQFLAAMGAGGAALLAPGTAGAATRPRLRPTDLSFAIQAQYRPFEIVARGFEAIRDDFRGGVYPYRSFGTGTAEARHGRLTIAGERLLTVRTGPRAPYAAVEARVSALDGTVYAGLIAGRGDYVVATYDATSRTVAVEVARGGARRTLVQVATELTTPFTFAFVLNENNVIALADTGSGFVPLARANVASLLDMRDPHVLRRFDYGFGAQGTVALDSLRAGYWGKAGVRDPHVVTWADGTPFIVDGKVYLTLTNAGLGFFEFAHWGVYTLDLRNPTSPSALRHVGKIFWERGGVVVGDHAGHIVYDDAIGAFRLLVSNWGTFSGSGVLVNSAVVDRDVLHGVTVVRDPEVLPLPTDESRWDPHMVRIGHRWHVAFVESPSQNPFTFHPALARGPRTGEFGRFRLVGRDAARTMTEGMVMQKIGGRWWVLCSSSRDEGPPEGGHYRIYDLDMRFVGFLDAPYPTNIPHPMVFPVPLRGGRTQFRMVTFNGTQYHEDVLGYGTHGDFYVMTGRPVERGWEFPPRRPPVI